MSTRANIIIKDETEKLWFYRHRDGYPEGALPTLIDLMKYVAEGSIRKCVGQASGWLIMIGAKEYGIHEPSRTNRNGWKVGSYEATTSRHFDIDYLYILDLDKLTIDVIGAHQDESKDKYIKTILVDENTDLDAMIW